MTAINDDHIRARAVKLDTNTPECVCRLLSRSKHDYISLKGKTEGRVDGNLWKRQFRNSTPSVLHYRAMTWYEIMFVKNRTFSA